MYRRIALTRTSFIPAGAVKVADKASDAVAYLYTDARARPCARVFYGKQSKPVVYCYYRNEAERAAAVTRAFESRRGRAAFKAKSAADRKAAGNPFKVGDILGTCWGYEQTNREFYQVIAVSGVMVTVREIGQKRIETSWAAGKTVPMPGQFVGEELRRRVSHGGIRIHSSARATEASHEIVAGMKVYSPASWSATH